MSGVVVTTVEGKQYRYLDAASYDNDDTGLDIMDDEGRYLATFNAGEWSRIEYVAGKSSKETP